MSRQPGFLDPDDLYVLLRKSDDPLERLASAVNVGAFRFRLEKALKRSPYGTVRARGLPRVRDYQN